MVKKGEVARAVVAAHGQGVGRKDGSYIRSDRNAWCLIKVDDNPVGTRFGRLPASRETGSSRRSSLAPEVI
jgi:large subunit ribosomal protein L14